MHKAVLWLGPGPQSNLLKMSIFDHEVSNKTRYGIENDAWRFTWAGYYIFVILSSLLGDSTILVASIKYKAIKLHKVIVTIIQHIAVCDLLVVTLDVLPKLTTIVPNRWVLGQVICSVLPFPSYSVNPASILLICPMTTFKVLLVKYPLRFGSTSSMKAHITCLACWGIPFIVPALMLVVDSKDVYFSYKSYTCAYGFSKDIWKNYLFPLGASLMCPPLILVVANSVQLLVIAKQVAGRQRDSLKLQGIITTVLTATVFCVSWLPIIGMLIIPSSVAFERIVLSFMFLNTMCNFYIYCITVTSFRRFVRSRLQDFFKIFYFSTFRGLKICKDL